MVDNNDKICNLNYFYNVEYYKNLGIINDFNSNNIEILKYKARKFEDGIISCKKKLDVDTLYFKTNYPGLLVGSGYLHESNNHGDNKNDELSLGYSFDYVTGLPYIPSSSVKGVLRSAFNHWEYIKELLGSLKLKGVDNLNITELEYQIFGKPSKKEVKDEFKDKVFANEDIFHDAILNEKKEEGVSKKLMAIDNITPHRMNKKLLELAEPKPISFIKVAPDIEFMFRFKLVDSIIDDFTVTIKNKLNLFERILMDFGIGSKTNVGYGVLISEDEVEKNKSSKKKAVIKNVKPKENEGDSKSNLSYKPFADFFNKSK